MPRGNPKRAVLVRIDPAMLDEVRKRGPLTSAIEAGLSMWLTAARQLEAAKAKRKPAPEGGAEA